MKAKDAIQLLRYVPEQEFITGTYESDDGKKCCSLGWLNLFVTGNPHETGIEVALLDKSVVGYLGTGIVPVNDKEKNDRFIPERLMKIPSIKQRVLTLLRDMDKAGY